MTLDRKRLYKALLLIFLAFIMWVKIPHINLSLSEILLPRIREDKLRSTRISGILVFILLYLSYKQLTKSNLLNNNKIIIVILLVLIIPHTFDMLEIIKEPYYIYSNSIKSIEVIDDGYCFDYAYRNICDIHVYAKLKNYKSERQEFKISLILPQELVEKQMPKEIVLPEKYIIEAKEELIINKRYDINELHSFRQEDVESEYYQFIDYKIKLFNDKESIVINLPK